MTRKEYILSKKFYLKGLAKQIRLLKYDFKESQRQNNTDIKKLWDLQKAKYEFRHEHIAHCLVRKVKNPLTKKGLWTEESNRFYERIESKVRENNYPNFDYIEQIIEKYPVVPEICDEVSVCVNS